MNGWEKAALGDLGHETRAGRGPRTPVMRALSYLSEEVFYLLVCLARWLARETLTALAIAFAPENPGPNVALPGVGTAEQAPDADLEDRAAVEEVLEAEAVLALLGVACRLFPPRSAARDLLARIFLFALGAVPLYEDEEHEDDDGVREVLCAELALRLALLADPEAPDDPTADACLTVGLDLFYDPARVREARPTLGPVGVGELWWEVSRQLADGGDARSAYSYGFESVRWSDATGALIDFFSDRTPTDPRKG